MNPENRLDAKPATRVIEARCHARFKLSIDVKIRSHSSGLLMGRMVDISESGTAAMLTVEVPLDDVVQLEFALSLGWVEIAALVRQRSAFRYGFQFAERGASRELIERTCRQLYIDQFLDNVL